MGIDSIHPPLEPVRAVVDRLQAAGITAALGGSGLLAAHGLVQHVHDWDLTTDAPAADVLPLLAGLDLLDGTDPVRFRTERRLVVRLDGAEVDLMCRSAIPGEPEAASAAASSSPAPISCAVHAPQRGDLSKFWPRLIDISMPRRVSYT